LRLARDRAGQPDYADRIASHEDRREAWIGSNWAVMHRLAVGTCGPADAGDVLAVLAFMVYRFIQKDLND
jgi:hypothetical protein